MFIPGAHTIYLEMFDPSWLRKPKTSEVLTDALVPGRVSFDPFVEEIA